MKSLKNYLLLLLVVVLGVACYSFVGCKQGTVTTGYSSYSSYSSNSSFSGSTSTSSKKSSSSKINYANEISISQNSQAIFTFTSEGEITGLTAYGNGLSTLYIPSSINGTKIETISANAFANKTMTTVLVLPGIKTIGENAFINCSNLTSVYIADSVTTINARAFYACLFLEKVVLGANLKEIKGAVFYNCSRLKEIVIPQKVKSIGPNTFCGCSKLSSVTFEYKSGWQVTGTNSNSWTNVSVTDAEKNAKILNEYYVDRQWTNKNL